MHFDKRNIYFFLFSAETKDEQNTLTMSLKDLAEAGKMWEAAETSSTSFVPYYHHVRGFL